MSLGHRALALGVILGTVVVVAYAVGSAAGGDARTSVSSAPVRETPPRVLAPPRLRRDPRPDILLFTVDTLRADHLSAYGYARDTSPTMASLARRGTRFDRAHSTSSWTVPAVTSLVTGVIPSQHGVFHGQPSADGVVEQERISTTMPTLASVLGAAGYRTIGVTTNGHLAPEFGFDRGFDSYQNLGFGEADDLRAALDPQLEELRRSDRPFFLWVHVIDPHVPYAPNEPQFTEWWPSSRPRYPTLDRMTFAPTMPLIVRHDHLPPVEALEYVVTAYDSEIRHVDTYLEHLLAELDDGNLAVVLTSDHGEEFQDHHGMGHGSTLFEEQVRVPLIVAVPEQAPSVSSALVSIIDVLPTLAEITGTAVPSGPTGRSLMPAVRGETLPSARELTFESGRSQVLRGITDGHYKYGARIEPSPIEGLFDLESDPLEQHPCQSEHPDIALAMRDRMNAILDEASTRRPPIETVRVDLPPEIRAQLEALGYGN